MAPKISDELRKRLEEVEKTEAQQAIPVIVSVTPGTDLTALEQNGLRIQQIFENISAVAGILNATQANQLAKLDQVELIEYDGELWAL